MVKTIKKSKMILISILLVIVCGFVYCTTDFLHIKQTKESQTMVRNIEINKNEIDYQSILDEFENSKLETEGTLTSFVGYKSLNLAELDGFDLVSDSDIENTEVSVKYNFSYDKESNIVTLSAELQDELGEIYVDTLTGAAFINEDGEIDAVMNVDGEGILLSEMQDAGMIQNCGWFSRLIKKVVKIAVIAVTIAAVAVATAAVVVATAGAAAPALVAAGVGITTSAATTAGLAVGIAAGTLFAATIGMSAIKAGTAVAETIADSVEKVIDKVSGKILSILIKGVEYATVAVTASIIYGLEKNSYHLALLSNDGVVYISLTPIDRTLATWATRLNIPIYTFYSENAYQIAKDAGNGQAPNLDEAHIEKDGVLRKGIFFNHWHTYNHQGHCLFGVPYIQL